MIYRVRLDLPTALVGRIFLFGTLVQFGMRNSKFGIAVVRFADEFKKL